MDFQSSRRNRVRSVAEFARQLHPGAPVVQPESVNLSPFQPSTLPRNRAGHDQIANADPARFIPQAVFNAALYGDMQVVPVVFAAASEQLVLGRPSGTRIMLIIQNSILGGTITFTFDQVASATNGIQIGPGGVVMFDTVVPQNDLHVFSPLAGTAVVAYINKNIATATPP